jgi:hypothetical protein
LRIGKGTAHGCSEVTRRPELRLDLVQPHRGNGELLQRIDFGSPDVQVVVAGALWELVESPKTTTSEAAREAATNRLVLKDAACDGGGQCRLERRQIDAVLRSRAIAVAATLTFRLGDLTVEGRKVMCFCLAQT